MHAVWFEEPSPGSAAKGSDEEFGPVMQASEYLPPSAPEPPRENSGEGEGAGEGAVRRGGEHGKGWKGRRGEVESVGKGGERGCDWVRCTSVLR